MRACNASPSKRTPTLLAYCAKVTPRTLLSCARQELEGEEATAAAAAARLGQGSAPMDTATGPAADARRAADLLKLLPSQQ